jgi:hypothetical protein
LRLVRFLAFGYRGNKRLGFRFQTALQRFRPATYWAVIARRIEKMAKAGK